MPEHTDHGVVSTAATPPPPADEVHGLQFAALVHVEKETFRAGLRSRVLARVLEAVRAPTVREYQRLRDVHLHVYAALVAVLHSEAATAEPVSDRAVLRALDHVERVLGESWRHKFEHGINVAQSALKIRARTAERSDAATTLDTERATLLEVRWVVGWNRLNWAIDCVFASMEHGVLVMPEVQEAVFHDLLGAAEEVYVVASEVHDARFGDPDGEEDDE